MTIKTEGKHAGGYVVSEANGHRSRETITVKQGEVLEAGAVISLHSTDNKWREYQNDETDFGAVGILFDNVDATDGDVEAVAHVRDCEVNYNDLVWSATEDTGDRAAAITDLKAVGIIVRGFDE